MEKEGQKIQNEIGARKVIAYFWKMTMTNKRPFIIAGGGIILSSVASLMLPIYYTKIVDIVQLNSGDRAPLVPVLMGILLSMAIIEVFVIIGWRMF